MRKTYIVIAEFLYEFGEKGAEIYIVKAWNKETAVSKAEKVLKKEHSTIELNFLDSIYANKMIK